MTNVAADTNRSADEAGQASSNAASQTQELQQTIDGYLEKVAAA